MAGGARGGAALADLPSPVKGLAAWEGGRPARALALAPSQRERGSDGGDSRLISDGELVTAFARMTLLVCGFPLSRE